MSIPAPIMRSSISGDREAGPIVATIFVALTKPSPVKN
jgi:hypothetical protein